uniref:Uncharacterized protein n=1 Tax=Panagrolaimus sp. PS1159 TaxID=55785 RepID=A0AC35GWM7_9BILA
MKSFLVLFAIFSLCFALPLESEDADKPTTTEDPQKPEATTEAPGDTYSVTDKLDKDHRTHTYLVPTHIKRGVYFSLSATKGIGTLFVSLKQENPSANEYSFYTTASASPNITGELSLSSKDLIGAVADADKDKNDTTTYVTVAAESDDFSYTITWKPLDTTTTTTTTTTPSTPTTTTKSSSVMTSPKFFNSLLLIALYNFFTFSK